MLPNAVHCADACPTSRQEAILHAPPHASCPAPDAWTECCMLCRASTRSPFSLQVPTWVPHAGLLTSPSPDQSLLLFRHQQVWSIGKGQLARTAASSFVLILSPFCAAAAAAAGICRQACRALLTAIPAKSHAHAMSP